ncbi:MAG: hypothetical protein HJJLKODD_03035 [Phycisphaerae bacterium]|nr:hypothetical protein [Phycisphaerae bacterium]
MEKPEYNNKIILQILFLPCVPYRIDYDLPP